MSDRLIEGIWPKLAVAIFKFKCEVEMAHLIFFAKNFDKKTEMNMIGVWKRMSQF